MLNLRIFFLLILFCSALPVSAQAQAQVKSQSLAVNQGGDKLYSANFDTGTVSIIRRDDGKLLTQQTMGKDIRRLALAEQHQRLLATDFQGQQVVLSDMDSLREITRIPLASRVFGVVFDDRLQQFYVTGFDTSQLFVISLNGELTHTLATQSGPRGLALTDDGRLLVSHALSGEVSVFNTQSGLPVLTKVIQLADSAPDKVLTKPQGQPRLLDNIAISADGLRAWLPHVLWSFGHDFQFQSTVFPAISVLDLTPGLEREIQAERKMLFKQINIRDNANKTRIISNPHDIIFSENKKAIITLAGSEDLLLFDLSREGKRKPTASVESAAVKKPQHKRKKRHRRKKFRGGVKASQIYRNVPGNNPRGLVAVGEDVYVQNAMSLDLVKFNSGARGPFSRLTLVDEQFATLVSHDPMDPVKRLGKTLFNSANSGDVFVNEKTDGNSAAAHYPIAGDFWMSCNSCHLDGFNFTNKTLMESGLKNKFENAITGHVDPIKMIAGDPVAAYIDIIQKTQGGMGAEEEADSGAGFEKKTALRVDPYQPPLAVSKMMAALNEYVRSPENLPYLSTWLKLDDDKKTTHPAEWINSAQCKDCHSTIYNQWAQSNHGMNMDHPYYRMHEDFAAQEEGEEFRVLCRGCHAPQMVINGDNQPLSDFSELWKTPLDSSHPDVLEQAYAHGKAVNERGTGCVFCHRITRVEDAGGNADITVNLKDRESYVFEDSSQFLLQWLAKKQIDADPQAHKESYSDPQLYQSALYCASCHNEFTSGPGANINDNFGEWLASPFNAPDDPAQHKTCIDCHMTQDVSDFDHRVAGISTDDGPLKQDMRSHHFSGGNYYLSGKRSAEHKKLSIDILKTALTLQLHKEGGQVHADITNVNSGHDMPGGARRQVWLELTVTDANGQQVFSSGVMEDGYIPADARKFIKIGVDKNNKPVGLRFWRYDKIGKDTRIKSGQTRRESFTLPADSIYPLTVNARVLYQVFSRQLSEKVRRAFPEQNIEDSEVVELVRQQVLYSD